MNVSSIFSLVERMMPISLHQLSNQCMRVNRPFWASVLWCGGSIECFNLALLFRISGSIWNRIWLVYNNLCISCYLEAPAMLAQCAHGLANTKTDEEQKRVCRCLCVIILWVVWVWKVSVLIYSFTVLICVLLLLFFVVVLCCCFFSPPPPLFF